MEGLLVSEHLQEEKKVSVNGGNDLQDKWLLTGACPFNNKHWKMQKIPSN